MTLTNKICRLMLSIYLRSRVGSKWFFFCLLRPFEGGPWSWPSTAGGVCLLCVLVKTCGWLLLILDLVFVAIVFFF